VSKFFAVITIIACAAVASGTAALASQVGMASYYRSGKMTANGEKFNPHGHTAAHRSLPFGTKVRVVNVRNGKAVVVRINDRGPFIRGRIIDLALGAAHALGLHRAGLAKVRLEILN
jgi:rare lipoprotein A